MEISKKRILNQYAVSAVIGVTLMVAVTIAMAAVAYAYFTGMIGSPQQQVPVVSFEPDENQDRIKISTTDPGVQWEDLGIRSTEAVTIYVNGEETSTGAEGTAIAANTLVDLDTITFAAPTTSASDLDPSDFIDIEGTTAALEDVTITIVHIETGSTIEILDFATIAQLAD